MTERRSSLPDIRPVAPVTGAAVPDRPSLGRVPHTSTTSSRATFDSSSTTTHRGFGGGDPSSTAGRCRHFSSIRPSTSTSTIFTALARACQLRPRGCFRPSTHRVMRGLHGIGSGGGRGRVCLHRPWLSTSTSACCKCHHTRSLCAHPCRPMWVNPRCLQSFARPPPRWRACALLLQQLSSSDATTR